MAVYEDYRVAKLARGLESARIDPDIVVRIMEGGEHVRKTDKPERKAEWLAGAMRRMDDLLDRETRYAIREGSACCLGGKRHEISRSIAKQHATLEERIAAANEARFVFGHGVKLLDDGKVLVEFFEEGHAPYTCPCLKKAEERLSITYCYCCGGHATLGRKLKVQVRSSVLSSGGTQPCTFLFSFAN
jgi:hypothetical protein